MDECPHWLLTWRVIGGDLKRPWTLRFMKRYVRCETNHNTPAANEELRRQHRNGRFVWH